MERKHLFRQLITSVLLTSTLTLRIFPTVSRCLNKQIIKAHQTTVVTKPSLSLLNTSLTPIDPWFITGFCDAESNFTITTLKNKTLKLG